MNNIEWLPPERIPDLSDAKEIAIDLETYDPGLKDKGPGWARKEGRVVGVALAVDGWKGYFPVAHEGGGNFEEKFFKISLKKILDSPCDKIFHNASYDVGWLRQWGLSIQGRLIDTMVAAPLIDENRTSRGKNYSLNDLSKDYLGDKKQENELYSTGLEHGVDPKAEMHKLPPMVVGPYAEKDAELTLKLWNYFKKEIVKQELTNIFNLETKLLPTLIDMKWKGVKVSVERAEKLKKILEKKEKALLDKIFQETGVMVDIWAATSVAKAFDAKDIIYGRTEINKQPQFTKAFLANHPHSLPRMITEAREINKARTTFINSIIKHEHKGRIHADINQLKTETGGTVSGRLSMQHPNLQQIPARHPELGPMIRNLFLPDDGCEWGSFDYSQQEPRILLHFASSLNNGKGLRGTDKLVELYRTQDPDFHQAVAEMAGIDRKTAKTINLGLSYGMGKTKLGNELGLNKEETNSLFKQYHATVPFLKALTEEAMQWANSSGFLRTLEGRRCRFDLWQPATFDLHKPLPYKEAHQEYVINQRQGLRRAFTYKALNRIIQGSAADQTKKAMIALAEENIIPHIQVHDELNLSLSIDTRENIVRLIKEIMETCIELKIPSKVEPKIGTSWGNLKKIQLTPTPLES
jgi:DNA polymerase I-like protein with 3'-5' exonuclease and polymerase domains